MSKLKKIYSIFYTPEYDSDLSGAWRMDWHDAGQQTKEKLQRTTHKNKTVSKIYNLTTRYNSKMQKKDIFCFDDSKAEGEYFSLDLNLWKELDYSIDEFKRINIGRPHTAKEVRVFIHTGKNGELKKVDNIIMFDRRKWAELRRVRGENRGLPLDVNSNGTIWIGDRYSNMDLKIFIRSD